jgi:hypothetical protein
VDNAVLIPVKNGGTCYFFNPDVVCVCAWPWGGDDCTEYVGTKPICFNQLPASNDSSLCYHGSTSYNHDNANDCSTSHNYGYADHSSASHNYGDANYRSTSDRNFNYFKYRFDEFYFDGKFTIDFQVIHHVPNHHAEMVGTCVPRGDSYSCFCGLKSIYSGKNCDSTAPLSKQGSRMIHLLPLS